MGKIDERDVEPCPGASPKHPCGARMDPAIQGFDGKFRCYRCQRIHTELVYTEAGNSAPDPGSENDRKKNLLAVAKGNHGDTARRQALVDRYGRPIAPGAVDKNVNADRKQRKGEEDRGTREAARRAAIVKKYGIETKE